DEPKLLQGLHRLLRGKRHEWDVDFVSSGREALECLARHPADVIVSDMRMPEMDGVELLTRVKDLYPNTIRIALSGYSEQEMTIRSVGPAHQFLAKPCDPDTLIGSITRATALRNLLESPSLTALVANIESLPSLPGLYHEVMAEIGSPDGSLKRVGEIISSDVGMSAKVLQLVNSAFFGLPQHVSSPAQAVNLLGFETIKALVLTIHVFTRYENKISSFFPLEKLMEHSLHTAGMATIICRDKELSKARTDNAYLAGLLHDAGKLILAVHLPGQYQEVMEASADSPLPLHVMEKQMLGASHAEVGAYLVGLWGLPDDIVEAIAYHHAPERCVSSGFGPLDAVALANGLLNEVEPVPGLAGDATSVVASLAGAGCAGHLDKWRQVRDELIANLPREDERP
ncbi:MAG: HDOD domain-containing protein, partial [Desulfohalobiaceae bacterium]